MLANNNQAILRRLAQNSLRTNRRTTVILLLTIVVATLLVFGVFTVGSTYLSLSRLQDTRLYGADYDIALMNGFTDTQRQTLLASDEVAQVGRECYSGTLLSTSTDRTVNAGLLWCDETVWNVLRADVVTAQEGHYPRTANELMMSRDALMQYGLEDLGVGDHFTATVETNAGVQTRDFVLSGIWDGYGDQAPVYVSQAFFENSGYDLEASGILLVALAHDYVWPGTLHDMEASLDISGQQAFQVLPFIENSWKVLCGIIGLGLVICLSAYLLIYNMLHLQATSRMRYYGLLEALGMTTQQLKRLVARQMLPLAALGMAGGLVLGGATALVLMPRLLSALGLVEEVIETRFQPLALVASVLCVAVAIASGMRAPLKMVAQVTPLEAVKYRPRAVCGSRRSAGGAWSWHLALDQLSRDKKRTMVVFLSLAVSLSVFYCLTTVIASQGERTVPPLYDHADLIIRNDSETSEDMHSWQPILEGLDEEIAAIDGVASVETVTGVPYTMTDDVFAEEWLMAYSDTRPYLDSAKVLNDFRADSSRYYGMLKGIDAEAFDTLNAELATPLDREDFLNGEVCILTFAGIEVPESALSKPLHIDVDGTRLNLQPAAVSYEGYYGASQNIGPTLIVSKDWLDSLDAAPITLSMLVHYDAPYDEITEAQVLSLVGAQAGIGDIFYESQLEERAAIRESAGDLNETGAAIALLLLVVGMLNYVGTMAAGIQNRRLSFAIMESVGMTPWQIDGLLVREGLLYAAGALLLTAGAGTAVTWICFQAMNYMGVPFSVPILPMLAASALVVLLCVVVPLFTYRRLSEENALAARLRQYE